MEVKSFTYQKSVFGTYYKRGLLNLQKMDDHIAKMLKDGWEILTQTAHTGDRRILRPFEPYGSLAIHSAVDRIELLCFGLAAAGMVHFSPYPEGLARTAPRGGSGHVPFLLYSESECTTKTSDSLETWIAIVGYAVGLMGIVTLLLYMWN